MRSERWVRSLCAVANARAKKLEAKVGALRLADWKERLGVVPAGAGKTRAPTRTAFRWIKGPSGWQPSPLGQQELNDAVPSDPDDGPGLLDDDQVVLDSQEAAARAKVPLCDQAAVEQEAYRWGALWQEGEQYAGPDLPEDPGQLAALMPDAVLAAARTFLLGTGLGGDNISPRAVLRLSSGAIMALATLFMAFERAGTWCHVLDLVLIVLLPKDDGGF